MAVGYEELVAPDNYNWDIFQLKDESGKTKQTYQRCRLSEGVCEESVVAIGPIETVLGNQQLRLSEVHVVHYDYHTLA